VTVRTKTTGTFVTHHNIYISHTTLENTIFKFNVNISPNVDKMEKQKKYPTITKLFVFNFIVKLPSAFTEGRYYMHSLFQPAHPREYEVSIPLSSPLKLTNSYFMVSKHL
jgi:hypothetical protein